MSLQETKDASVKISKESSALSVDSIVEMFEIDVSDIGFNNSSSLVNNGIFRFHNAVKLISSNIIWQGNNFIAIPIAATGFEKTARGTLPTPKLALAVNDAGITALTELKTQIRKFDDLVGAKVTRKRTFAKFLDVENFFNQTPPQGFAPDPNAEFPNDIYFIDRKTNENKFVIEFQLASILDVEGLLLPSRTVVASRCIHNYRGEGCLYEYASRKNSTVHGDGQLPETALPVATINDELIYEDIITDNTPPLDKSEYINDVDYVKGDFIYIEKNGIKYYFVAKRNVARGNIPPNDFFWVQCECSKIIGACKLRWGSIGQGFLPFGGFPAANKLR